jgi:hyperosmotically inducible protein
MLTKGLLVASAFVFLTAAAGNPASDSWITMKSKLALATTEDIPSTRINVDTMNGVVSLYGKVASNDIKLAAERRIATVEGVKRVDNNLQVVATSQEKRVERSDDAIRDAAKKWLAQDRRTADLKVIAVDKGVLTLGGETEELSSHVYAVSALARLGGVRRIETKAIVKGEPALIGSKSTTPAAKDAWTTTQVKLRFIGEKDIPSMKINVDTDNGTVTLFGSVANESARTHAGKVAAKVEGVKKVQNEIVVDTSLRSEEKLADSEIKADVEKLLSVEDLPRINVAVKNGVVEIAGSVPRESDRTRAAMLSRSAKGARAVKNNVTISE